MAVDKKGQSWSEISLVSHSKYFLETRDGAGRNSQSWWRWQRGIFPYRLVLPSSHSADILAKCSFKVMEPCSYVRPWGLLPKNQPGFQLFWHGSWECEPDQWVHQLVSQAFCSYRINLSPFTKDFRGQEAKIEHSSIFLRLPYGSCYSTKINDITLVTLGLVRVTVTEWIVIVYTRSKF